MLLKWHTPSTIFTHDMCPTMQQNNYITSTCNDHDAVLSCRWQAEEDPTYALFEAALQGSSNRPTVTSARDAKLQKAKGRVGFAHGHNAMQPRPLHCCHSQPAGNGLQLMLLRRSMHDCLCCTPACCPCAFSSMTMHVLHSELQQHVVFT